MHQNRVRPLYSRDDDLISMKYFSGGELLNWYFVDWFFSMISLTKASLLLEQFEWCPKLKVVGIDKLSEACVVHRYLTMSTHLGRRIALPSSSMIDLAGPWNGTISMRQNDKYSVENTWKCACTAAEELPILCDWIAL